MVWLLTPVNLLYKIQKSLDRNSASEYMTAVLTMVDWSKAFDRQSHKLGIQSFKENGGEARLSANTYEFFYWQKNDCEVEGPSEYPPPPSRW